MSIFNEMNGAPMTESQIDAYLARINMNRPERLDLEYLTRLQFSHMSAIPYENLDVMAGRPASLHRETLFEKIIHGNRGGICSEINTLYNWLLESLGFETISYSSRIIASSLPIQTQSHRIMGVLMDRGTYLTDAGFNFEHHRIPLLLEEGLVQSDGECAYKLVKDPFWGWVMWQHRPEHGWRRKLGFTEEPHIDLDFVPATFFAESHPDSRINKCVKVSLYINGTFHAIRSNQYLTEQGGEERIIAPITDREQEQRILREIFHLTAAY